MYFEGKIFWGEGEAASDTRGFEHQRQFSGARKTSSKVVIELYGGLCGMSRAVARRGGIAESFEIMRDPREDLRRRSQRRALFARIRAGRVAGIWIGITCASWSRARRAPPGSRMPCALRDDGEFILGLPNLSEKDQVKVDDGNDSLVFLCTLIDLCLKHNTMIVVENPCTSRLWIAPALVSRILRCASSQNIDYCAFGETWRKRTRLISWVRPLTGLPPLCAWKKDVCSYRGQKHELLTGFGKGGAFKTAVASPHPQSMFRLIVPQLMEPETRKKR